MNSLNEVCESVRFTSYLAIFIEAFSDDCYLNENFQICQLSNRKEVILSAMCILTVAPGNTQKW